MRNAKAIFSALAICGQVTDQKWVDNAGTPNVLDEYGYAYDYDGNRKYRQNSGPSATNLDEAYTYDNLDRVTDLQHGTLSGSTISGTPAREQQFTLDELGNWPAYLTKTSGTTDMSQTRTHDKANELTHISGVSWVSPAVDANGNMTDMPIPGNETVKQTAVYDAWNRLAQVKEPTAALLVFLPSPAADISAVADPPPRRVAASPPRRVGLVPNGLNFRVQKLLGSNPSSPTSYYDYYYNENWQVLEERKGGSTNPYAQYVWDARYIDAPVVRFHDSNTDGTIDDTLYYATDANMNVTALVDTSGTVQERYTYDAYGQVHISDGSWGTRSSSSYDNQILFGGYRYDPETGLDHVRNRMYHPTVGRWGQREPIGALYVDGANLYMAFGSSPTNLLDSTGLYWAIDPRYWGPAAAHGIASAASATGSAIGTGARWVGAKASAAGSEVGAGIGTWWNSRPTRIARRIAPIALAFLPGGLGEDEPLPPISVGSPIILSPPITVEPPPVTLSPSITVEPQPVILSPPITVEPQPVILAPPITEEPLPSSTGAPSGPGRTCPPSAGGPPSKGMGGRVLSPAEQGEFDAFGARARAQGLVENPYRTGSWGKMENGKFVEKTRIDVGEAGKPGFRGQTHIHVEGQDGHLDPTTKIPGE